jgi:hypothetical protein
MSEDPQIHDPTRTILQSRGYISSGKSRICWSDLGFPASHLSGQEQPARSLKRRNERKLTIHKLTSNHITFLERICSMFEGIGSTLTAYEDFLQMIQSRAHSQGRSYPRLAKALSYVYLDVLRFCHSVCILFSRSQNGKASL